MNPCSNLISIPKHREFFKLCAFCFEIKEDNELKKLKGNFTIIPNEYITDENLDCYEYRILCFLCKLSDEENTSYPSYETIARKTNISISKVKRAIENLIAMKYISKETRRKNNGSRASNIYTVSEKTCGDKLLVLTDTTDSVLQTPPHSVPEIQGGISENHNQYTNINKQYFINTKSSSIEDVFEKAEIDNLYGESYKEFKSAIEKMYNQKYITVSGEKIPQALVRERLKNISYEHVTYVDNNMPRTLTSNHEIVRNVANPVAYIISSLYNALKYNEQELLKMQYGDDILFQNSE